MISPSQIRAARAMVDWSQSDLAERAGLTQATVANIEGGKHTASASSNLAIKRAFEDGGVEFVADGVRKLRWALELTGDDVFPRLLQDACRTLTRDDDELIIFGANNSKMTPEVERYVRTLAERGVSIRLLSQEGDVAPLYGVARYIPSAHFMPCPTTVYRDRVAIVIEGSGDATVQIIVNKTLAEAQRRLFNFMWEYAACGEERRKGGKVLRLGKAK